jgi:hypothetical protein
MSASRHTKYKVGDEVVLVNPLFNNYVGKIYTIVSTRSGYAWIQLFNNNEGNAVDDTWVTPATKLHKALA